jgi:SAM-dependent methyltransferase
MLASPSFRGSAFALLLACSTLALAQSQTAPSLYEPTVGQAGKDVVWVPTPQALVDKMLDMAKVTPNDFVIDLGSGDGRTVITAAKRGARAIGIEYNPEMVELSKANAQKEGVTGRATFMKADLFETDLSKATVITMFLLPGINLKLRPKLLALKPGTRVVSNTFTMGDWDADETATVGEGCGSSWCTALLWIIPARVGGTWKVSQGEVTLKQQYQMLSGTLRAGGKTVPVEGKVRGEEIVFTAGGREYHGKMNGKQLELQ